MSPVPSLLKSSRVSVTAVSNTGPAFFEMAYRTVSGFSCISRWLWAKLPRWLSVWPGGTNSEWKIPLKRERERERDEEEDKKSQRAFVVDPKLPRSLRTRRGRYCPLTGLLLGFWDVTINPRFISRLSGAVWLLQWLLNDVWNPITHAETLYLKVSVRTLIWILEKWAKIILCLKRIAWYF
jgi:hypothetical protein